MDINIKTLLFSFVFIGLVLGIATLVAKTSKGSSETSRKLIHILVGNWVFMTPYFTELWAVLFVPFSFVIINSLSHKYHLVKAMERNDDSLGTIYYAISMLLLTGIGFVFKQPLLPFIGLLTMAYGDGLAAIIGQKFSKQASPQKSRVGSLTVLVVSFVVTLSSYLILGTKGHSLILLIGLSILVSLFSTFVEYVGYKGVDNLTLPIGSGVMATLLYEYFSIGLIGYLFLSLLLLIFAYKKKAITQNGIVMALLVAINLYVFSTISLSYSLLLFFVLGSLVSKVSNTTKKRAEEHQEQTGARTWFQVISNGLPAVICAWLFALTHESKFILMGLVSFSVASSDTFSSEIGMLTNGKVFDILSFKEVEPGVSGGVSLMGFIGSIVGSLLLSLMTLIDFNIQKMMLVMMFGIIGSILDSVLGASLQRKFMVNQQLVDYSEQGKVVKGISWMSNSLVNLISISLMVIISYFVF